MFKTALERMPSDTHKFVIRADCTPTGEHVRRFNAPTVNDVAAIIVGDPTKSRDIVVQRRSNIMHRVNETHRLYDALQYPIIYWQGQDGYDITLKMVDPITGVSTNKNLSAMNYYAYRMMIRTHEENVILKCRRLFQQFFQMGRYVSTNEALWRLLSFQIHERYPTVVHLAVHLENGQRVYFTEANAAQRAERPPSTTLTSFFAMCEADPFAATLMYVEMPKYYTWNPSTKKFQRRKQGTPVPDWPQVFSSDALGRMYTVHPRNDECFYLRLLLVNVRVPKSFAHLKTVNGHQCQTYREACQLLGLLENDSHWDLTLADSVVSSNAYQIRTLFAIIITTCFPSQPIQLWNKYKDAICEDILHRLRIQTNNPDIQITDEIYNEGLILIEDQCLTIANKLLIEVGMIAPNRSMHDAFNQELNRELQYNVDTLQEFVRNNVPLLNEQQKQVYETLMQAVDNNTGGLFFLDAPGGTGKTFVISLILATIRSRCDIALALASSGIAATLLDGGRTAHSALKLPLNLNTIDTPTCNISRSSAMGKLLMQCKLIVWDECTMAHKKSLEALNFTLKDLRRNNNIFGGLMILLAGDFRQTLPVVPRGTPADELNACLKASPLWNNVKTLSLSTNMRVQLQNDQSAAQFSKQLLDVGNGKVQVDATSGLITLTNDFCRFVDTQLVLIENVFPNISENYKNYAWLSQRAILAAKNNDVHALNFTIQSKIAGDLVTYKSVDSMTNPDDVVNYPTEFLNSLEIPGFPPHNLQLKVGTVIMILRNLNPPRLCNGTRLSVKRLMPNLIEATIINGKYAVFQYEIDRLIRLKGFLLLKLHWTPLSLPLPVCDWTVCIS
ncbi:unnamed protein product [Spodoptera exigua]|nr:unnamed protein product [Spodoptera exigua]